MSKPASVANADRWKRAGGHVLKPTGRIIFANGRVATLTLEERELAGGRLGAIDSTFVFEHRCLRCRLIWGRRHGRINHTPCRNAYVRLQGRRRKRRRGYR